MPQWLLNLLLRYVAPELAALLRDFLANLERERADDPTVLATVRTIVDKIDRENPDWAWSDKIQYASNSALAYLTNVGKDVSRAAINSIIDLHVIAKREQVPPNSARTLGSTEGQS